jgi:hypothetical protein
MFSEEGEDKRTFWQKHKGKILAGAALAAAGGAGYYYRGPIKKKAGELYDAAGDLADKAYYKYWMSEEDVNNELSECWDSVKSLDIDRIKTIPGRLEKVVKFCIYNAGDGQPAYVQETKKNLSELLKYAKEAVYMAGQSDLYKKFNDLLDKLKA